MVAWILAGLALTVPFTGKPVHLACAFQTVDRDPRIDILIDGSQRAVTLTIPTTGHVERQPTARTGTVIAFDSPLPYGNVHYAIDRTALSIVRTTSGPAVPAVVDTGKCAIEPAPKPAF